MERCAWVTQDQIYIDYHDTEWGVPVHDDRALFEKLILEGAQSGLSWITILKRRESYRRAFDNFDILKVSQYTEADIERLMADPGIIRNRLKVQSAIKNAHAVLALQAQYGSFSDFVWSFVGGQTIHNAWNSVHDVPAQTEISVAMSKAFKKVGMSFVGPTICYSFMQSMGLVNDHTTNCFRYAALAQSHQPQSHQV